MCSTSQCELRSTFPNLRVTNVIRIPAYSPSLGRSLRHFRLAKISVRGDGNLRHLSIVSFRFRAIIIIIPMSGRKTSMASRRSASPCAGNARKKECVHSHFNPDWVKEWPALIAKSHKGDTDAFVAFVVATLAFLRVSQKRTRPLL